MGSAPMTGGAALPSVSVVVPAHNEELSIARLLTSLLGSADPGEMQVLVVCNGTTDDTARIATSFGPDVRVIEIPEASKRLALDRGDRESAIFPRLYVDADVEVSTASVRLLLEALSQPGVLVAGPSRELVDTGVSMWVRWYESVWERLPAVQSGLFGRGVIALNQDAYVRIDALPNVLSDDGAISEAFSDSERRIIPEATVRIRLPKSLADLIRRRVRVMTGNRQLDSGALRTDRSMTTIGTLVVLARQAPLSAPKVAWFVVVTAIVRLGAMRAKKTGDVTTWLRDDSSRKD